MPILTNTVHEMAAQYFVRGLNKADALRKAQGNKAKNAPQRAAQVFRRSEVKARVTELQEKIVEKVEEETVNQLKTVSREEVIDALAQMFRAKTLDPDLLKGQNNLTDAIVTKTGGLVVTLPKRLAIAERLAKMHGWDKTTVDLNVKSEVMKLSDKFEGDD